MNMKFLALAMATCGLAAAHPHHPPFQHPNCTVGIDTQSCTLPMGGGEGMFVCRQYNHSGEHWWHHDHHHHDGSDGDSDDDDDDDDHSEDEGGILGAFRHAVKHLTGSHHHSGSKHHHGHHHGGHDGKPCHKDDPHRQLRSSSSSSSSSSSRSGGRRHHRHGHDHHGHGHDHHGHDHHGHGHGHGGMGPHGHGGPPHFVKMLSDTHCVPVDGPPAGGMDHLPFHPFGGDHDHDHHDHDHDHDHNPPTCGCCGDVCPTKLTDCGCTCDVTDFEGNVMPGMEGKGIWVTITMKRDETKTIQKCIPAGAYADANRVQCVTECPTAAAVAELVEEEAKAMELLEDSFGDEEELDAEEDRD